MQPWEITRALSIPDAGVAHVWVAKGTDDSEAQRWFEDTLSLAERAQANKFRFERDRMRYLFSQGVLRGILAQYLHCVPANVEFEQDDFGKPSLRGFGTGGLMFNMSHSEDLVVVAITLNRFVGVDTEFVRQIDDLDGIARRYFTNDERALLEGLDAQDRYYAFYTCWTRKEAFIKAIGKGLSIPLDSFDVAIPRGIHDRELPSSRDAPNVNRWWLCDLNMPDGYVGALVVEGEEPRVIYMNK